MNTRKELIVKYCKNKKVLNVGCTSDFPEDELKADLWLHKNIEEHTRKLVGIDIRENLLKKCQKYTKTKLIFADATNFNLNETFDTIFAGEIIEHVSN